MSASANFGTFASEQPTHGPAIGDSAVEYYVGPRGFDGGIHNSPFTEYGIKDPFKAPGQFNPFMFMRPRRRRINLLSIVQVMSLPFIIFALNSYLFGFSVRQVDPMWCWVFLGFCLILSGVFFVKAAVIQRKQKQEKWTTPWYMLDDDDTWFMFLAAAIAISCLLGLAVGELIYEAYAQPYYRLSQLHSYSNVDPIAQGQAYLDAGAINFKNDSFVDVSHGVGYKDGSVYCVAPIKLGTDNVANYDFFTVGVDCCTGFPGSFKCHYNDIDEFSAGAVHAGLRMVDDATIPYFKLAVMQADAEWGKRSPNPIFLTWTTAPTKKIADYFHDAQWTYFVSLAAFVVFEAACIGIMASMYWRDKLWG